MNPLHVATLAPHEFATFLEFAVLAGRNQAKKVKGDLNKPYVDALDKATVAVSKVRLWAGRREPARSAVNRVPAYAHLPRSRVVNNASIKNPVDEYSPAIQEALNHLSEAGRLFILAYPDTAA